MLSKQIVATQFLAVIQEKLQSKQLQDMSSIFAADEISNFRSNKS